MSKKKVSRNVISSSSGKKTSQGVKTKGPVVRDVISRPAVEQLNIPPPDAKSETSQPNVEAVVAPAEFEAAVRPIFSGDRSIEEEKEEIESKIHVPISKPELESGILKWVGVFICSVVVIFWLIVLSLSIQMHNGPYTIERNITSITKVPVALSFDEVLGAENDCKSTSDGRIVSLQGYLRNNSKGTLYMIDDNGKKIATLVRSSQKPEYGKLFTNNTKVKTPYNVTGVYRFSASQYVTGEMGECIIDPVDSIQLFTKTFVEVSTSKLENFTIDEKKGVAINITQGWTKVNSMIKKKN